MRYSLTKEYCPIIPYRYLYDGGNLIRIEKGSGTSLQYIDFLYDGATLFGFRFCDVYTPINRIYYYLYGHGGNVEGILDAGGNVLVRYIYDAWGNFTEELTFEGQQNPFNVQALALNPFRYRGYVYDFETGFYYLQSRYYDPQTGRFISPDDTEYLGANGDLNGYNLYAYCSNNPVMYTDPTGHFITALIIGMVVGAVVGGAAGGVISYNAAKASGAEGSELFWETVEGVGKGAAIGCVLGGVAAAVGSVAVAYEATTIAYTAVSTTAATIAARTAEVALLQTKKSLSNGDNAWQVADDCFDSVFNNGVRILSPMFSKTGTTFASYTITDIAKCKVVPLDTKVFLKSYTKGTLSYLFAVAEYGQVLYSAFCNDPIARANQRGYTLK